MSESAAGATWLLAELIVLFLAVAFLIDLGQRRFGHDRVRRWMGGHPLVSALKGIAIGFVTPFCTYSAIPMLVGLRRAGVPAAGYVAFLTAAPVLDPVLFGALALIVGLPVALVYSGVAFAAALLLALLAQAVGIEDHLKSPDALEPAGTTECSSGAGQQSDWQGLVTEGSLAGRYAIGLLRSVGLLLGVGVLVGLLIETLVQPSDVVAVTGGNAGWSIPLAAALGTPLYFSTSLFVPIANSLSRAGLGIGAVVALTISGAGANIPEFLMLTKLAATRLIVIFCGYVFLVALVGGLIAQTMFG